MTPKTSKRGRPARDPSGTPAEKLIGAKVTASEHEHLESLARGQGMTLSDFVRGACARVAAELDPEWWKAEEEARMLIDAALGPAEVRRFYAEVRAAFIADGPADEMSVEAERRFHEWLHHT